MPYYSKETIDEIKQIDLLTYLQNYEPGELVRINERMYSTREHDSLSIAVKSEPGFKWLICPYSALKILGIREVFLRFCALTKTKSAHLKLRSTKNNRI